MNTSEIIDRAASLVEERGWWQNGPAGSGGGNPVCASNAISAARGEGTISEMIAAQRALWEYLGGNDLETIWDWNDAPERTAHQVVATMRACAVIQAAREEQDAAYATYAGQVVA